MPELKISKLITNQKSIEKNKIIKNIKIQTNSQNSDNNKNNEEMSNYYSELNSRMQQMYLYKKVGKIKNNNSSYPIKIGTVRKQKLVKFNYKKINKIIEDLNKSIEKEMEKLDIDDFSQVASKIHGKKISEDN